MFTDEDTTCRQIVETTYCVDSDSVCRGFSRFVNGCVGLKECLNLILPAAGGDAGKEVAETSTEVTEDELEFFHGFTVRGVSVNVVLVGGSEVLRRVSVIQAFKHDFTSCCVGLGH